ICPHSQHEKERKPGIEDVMESLRDLDVLIYELLAPHTDSRKAGQGGQASTRPKPSGWCLRLNPTGLLQKI
ncbi:MAG: hypothetical protein DRH15_01140, partial [Deltaproteobacteria bacterium]